MKNFEAQWKALKERKKNEDSPDVPKITKALPIMKWTEAFPDFLRQIIGVRMIPLIYVIRTEVVVPAAAPALENNQPHSTEHGSVESELIARASHTNPLYRDDNGKVYFYLEEATRATVYAASIKPFQRGRDGRGAWFAIIGQYAGVDKWEAEIKKQEQLLHTRKWKGQSNFSWEAFVSQHRNAFVSMTACSNHVQYQLPNEHSRVGFLLEAIECSDAGLQAAMASVKTDNGANGMRNDFEAAVAHILPYDPVAKKRASGKRGSALISDVQADGHQVEVIVGAAKATKPSIGKTGVHLRYHKGKEYAKLSKEQNKELGEWRASLPDGDPRKPPTKKPKSGDNDDDKPVSKKQVASIITKEFKELKAALKGEEEEKAAPTLISMLQAELEEEEKKEKAKPASTKTVTLNAIRKSILKKSKNGNSD